MSSVGAVSRAGRPPVVLLSGIRWDFLWQRHQILATLFARAGYRTVFVETTGLTDPRPDPATIRKVLARVSRSFRGGKRKSKGTLEPNLTVYGPLVLPPTHRAFRAANRRFFVPRVARDLGRLTGGERPVVIAYPPTQTTLDLVDALEPRLLLYDCSENYEGFPGIPRDIGRTERELLKRADIVSCTSGFLLEKVRRLRPDAFLSGPGVDFEMFASVRGTSKPGDYRTVCFFGHLGEERVDFSILRSLAEAGFVVRLVSGLGRGAGDLVRLPGVDYRGEVPHARLPEALAGADALVIPYKINTLTRGISPAKVYEALATGLPVVSTPLPEMVRFGDCVYLAEDAKGFVEILRNLPEVEKEEQVRVRIECAQANSWEARFADIERRILLEL
jgi:glycosyltransferase involved in cell wall biosynthesis